MKPSRPPKKEFISRLCDAKKKYNDTLAYLQYARDALQREESEENEERVFVAMTLRAEAKDHLEFATDAMTI